MSARLVYEMSRMALCENDGRVIVFKVAMDESGVHDDSPVLTVAAYIAKPREWQEWAKQWRVAKRPIKVFHAADAANLRGEFEGWSEEARDKLVIDLLGVINRSGIPGVVIGIHMDEFRKAMAGRHDLQRLFGTPYAACFQWVVQIFLNLAIRARNRDRIGFIHEVNDYRQEALDCFVWEKENVNANRIIGLQFATKEDYMPLQAADILAYEGNKRFRDPSRPERRPWRAINPDKRILAAHYGRENMGELIDRLEKVRDGKISEIDPGESWRRSHFQLDAAWASQFA
jgi:hypothetical protein